MANCTIIIGSEAEVLGWGSHTDKEELSALKKINVQLKSTEECGDSYENSIICAAHVAESDIFVDVCSRSSISYEENYKNLKNI